MAAKKKPVISRSDYRNLCTSISCWNDDVERFKASHGAEILNSELVYPLPHDLIVAVHEKISSWFSDAELAAEKNLTDLCKAHHAIGIFHGRPATYPLFNRPEVPWLSEELFQRLGWGEYFTIQQARRGFRLCFEQLDPLWERLLAYVGWLLTNPAFLAERDRLRARWENAIQILRAIPAYPVRVAEEKTQSRRPRDGEDALADFVSDFNSFFERWQLQRLPTWDLPEPCGANLTGEQLPSNSSSSVGRFTISIPATLRLPAHFPLQKVLEEHQRQQTPEHLRAWMIVQNQQHKDGLNNRRFEHMFQLAFFRDTVLASRYRDRFDGNVTRIDQAFADFLSLGVDSIKKLRLMMAALRRQGV